MNRSQCMNADVVLYLKKVLGKSLCFVLHGISIDADVILFPYRVSSCFRFISWLPAEGLIGAGSKCLEDAARLLACVASNLLRVPNLLNQNFP